MTSSLLFNGFDFTTPSSPRGGKFRLTALNGWLSSSLDRDRSRKSQQAGAWDSTGYTNPTPISASGQAVYASAAQAAAERREIVSLLGGGRYELTVVDAALSGTRIVECESFDVAVVNERMIRWSFTVTAVDPLVYGPLEFGQATLASSGGGAGLTYPLTYPLDYGVAPGATPGVVQVANAGTASYFPRIQIDGPVTNPRITLAETGDQLAFSGSIAAGQFLDFDCARRRVVLSSRANPDAAVSMRHKTSFVGAWLAVPVGGGSISWTADTADPASSLSVWSYEGAWS